jgi:hypothetical protein
MKLFCLLMLLAQITIISSEDCYFSANNFIRIFPNQTHENMRVYLSGYFGYSAISFSTSTKSEDVLFTVILWESLQNEKISNIGFIKSNNFTLIKEFNFTASEPRESGRNLFRSAMLTIPQEFLNKEFYLIFRNNFEDLPEFTQEGNWLVTSPPDEFSVKSLKTQDVCRRFSCDLKYRYRLIPLSVVLFALEIILVFLTILARNMQPIKSRGISLLIGLIYNSAGRVVDLIPFFVPSYNMEEAHFYDIYIHGLLRIPIDFTIRIVILFVNFYKTKPLEYSPTGDVDGCAEKLQFHFKVKSGFVLHFGFKILETFHFQIWNSFGHFHFSFFIGFNKLYYYRMG